MILADIYVVMIRDKQQGWLVFETFDAPSCLDKAVVCCQSLKSQGHESIVAKPISWLTVFPTEKKT